MRSYILSILFLIFGWACQQNDEEKLSTNLVNNPKTGSGTESEQVPEWKFDQEVYEFGQVSQGEKVIHDFTFTNIGKADLIITSAQGSCGCTVPEYPQHPIKPGEKGIIHVVFDTNGKIGKQNKTVTLVANTIPNTKVLALKGEVMIPEKNKN